MRYGYIASERRAVPQAAERYVKDRPGGGVVPFSPRLLNLSEQPPPS